MKEQLRNLWQPENRKYIPLAVLGLAKGLGALVIHELGRTPKEIQERQAASIQFYSTTPEEVPDENS